MIIKKLPKCTEFIARDKSILRELFNPNKTPLPINYSLAHACVKPGDKTLPHRLKTSEVYYILEGSGIMHIDSESKTVCTGDAMFIPPNATQYIHNNGSMDLKFLCIVNPAWKKEDEELPE